MELHKILVVIDPTSGDSQPSLERAIWIAERANSAIELLLCEYNSALDGGYFFDGPAQQKARESLLENRKKNGSTKIAQPLRDSGMSVNIEVRWGKPLHSMIYSASMKLILI